MEEDAFRVNCSAWSASVGRGRGFRAELFNLSVDLGVGVLSGRNVVDNDTGPLNRFLTAGGGGQERVNDLLKCFSGLAEMVEVVVDTAMS